MDTFGDRLRYFAKKEKGSLTALASEAGIEVSQLTKYAKNLIDPSLDVLRRLHATGVSIDWLMRGVGDMLAPEDDTEYLGGLPEPDQVAIQIYEEQIEHARRQIEERKKKNREQQKDSG